MPCRRFLLFRGKCFLGRRLARNQPVSGEAIRSATHQPAPPGVFTEENRGRECPTRESSGDEEKPRLEAWVMVPVERIELPTFGLQNRCSTAELNRRIEAIGARWKDIRPLGSDLRRLEYQTCPQRARTSALLSQGVRRMEKAAFPAAFSVLNSACLTGRYAAGRPRRGTRCRGCRQSRCGGHRFSPPIGAVAMAAAVPTAPPTTPAATSPGQKPLLSSQRL